MNDLRDNTQGNGLASPALTTNETSAAFLPPQQGQSLKQGLSGESDAFDGSSVAFVGTGWEMFKIYFLNALLTVVTLGIYYVWGKTKMRRYLWGKSLIFREPLEYTGTGWEIFRSLLIVGSLFFVLNFGAAFASGGNVGIAMVFSIILLTLIMLLAPYSIYCALRFRFSRTYWRGIRGRMGGSALRFAAKGILLGLLLLITLGLAYPFVYQKLAHYAIGQARFGSASFRFESKAGALAKYYLPCWLISVLFFIFAVMSQESRVYDLAQTSPISSADIGIIVCVLFLPVLWLIFSAAQLNWLLGGICLASEPCVLLESPDLAVSAGGELQVVARIPLIGYFILSLTNMLAVIFSVGLAWPWARVRRLRYIASHLNICGNLDWATISQSLEAPVEYGEGLFSFFDLDLGF